MNTKSRTINPLAAGSRTALLVLAALLLMLFTVLALGSPAEAASKADKACKGWYEKQASEEQVREDNEAQISNDVDGDGCTGILAAPDSDGPVEGALKEGGVPDKEQGESGSGDGSGGEELAQSESETPAGGGSGDGGSGDGGSEDCAKKFEADSPEEQMREREEDQQFNVDNDGDGCIAEEFAEDSAGMDGTPADAPEGEPVPEASDDGGDGGLNGMVMGFFKNIMTAIWDWTFGWALESMSEAFKTSLLSLPNLEERGDLLSVYKGAVETLRPAILVGILVLGILMMVRSDNYDLAYAGFQGLPRLMGIALALAFLPQFMGELSRITAGITTAFFPGGQDIDAAGQELFKASIGNLAVTNFLNLILLIAAGWVGLLLFIVALLNKILYAVLFVSGAFALTASIVPSLNSLAGSWFRGVLASAAIPALWSIEMGVGTVVVTSPESIFGGMANVLGFISESAVTSIGAIITMWVMYKTPFKCIEWAFNVQLPGRGGLTALAKTGAALAIAIPAKTAIAHATKGLLNRSTESGGSIPGSTGDGKGGSKGGTGGGVGKKSISAGKQEGGAKTRQIQQIGNQGKRDRVAENVSKAHDKYARTRDRSQEDKEDFMQGGRRGSGGPGMNTQSGNRSENKG